MISLENKSARIFALTVLSLLSGVIFYLISTGIVFLLFGFSVNEIQTVLSNPIGEQQLHVTKIVLLFNSLGLFVIPAFVFAFFFEKNPFQYLKITQPEPLFHFAFVVLIFITFVPVVNLFVELNKQLVLPEFLSELENWMKTAEAGAERMTVSLLKMENLTDLIINIILIGLIPAVGEELIFRGILQQTINKNRKNYHLGIWLAAAIFSAIHLQFYGFLPRLLLGALFGYLFYWSGNIWIPIFAHFVNNSTAVLISYHLAENGLEEKLEKVGTTGDTWYISLIFALIFFYVLYRFRKLDWKNKPSISLPSSYST